MSTLNVPKLVSGLALSGSVRSKSVRSIPVISKSVLSILLLTISLLLTPSITQAQECNHRGVLDDKYCDHNKDLVADSPTDSAQWADPNPLIFTYTPVENPAIYKAAFVEFQNYLSKLTGKKVVYYTVHSNAAQIEAIRSGRLHIAGFSTGTTGYAVNLGGFVPFVARGTADNFHGYNLITVVKSASAIKAMTDLNGKIVAHTSTSSNSGNLAPRAIFPYLGITPGQDYTVKYSGKHDKSIMGVLAGHYDAAPVASDVFERMINAGLIKADDFRIIYTSPRFPTSAFGYAHDLNPKLVEKIKLAFTSFRFSAQMSETFGGADRFYPVTYQKDWAVIRDIAHSTGVAYTKNGLKKLAKNDAIKAAKKRANALTTSP
ncbi:MAG: phosphate/phosphite/phosphonate ABC transporter substrate-binding protein [Gammaproteobacteria bacterium]|nr:phosphate/phosphite/phosphonate ABC transporter substrate-binding protein [Gammaproteobacteria bacterium]